MVLTTIPYCSTSARRQSKKACAACFDAASSGVVTHTHTQKRRHGCKEISLHTLHRTRAGERHPLRCTSNARFRELFHRCVLSGQNNINTCQLQHNTVQTHHKPLPPKRPSRQHLYESPSTKTGPLRFVCWLASIRGEIASTLFSDYWE